MVFTFPFFYGTLFAGRGKKFHTTKYKGCALRSYKFWPQIVPVGFSWG